MAEPFWSRNDSHKVIDYYHYHYNTNSRGNTRKAVGGFHHQALSNLTKIPAWTQLPLPCQCHALGRKWQTVACLIAGAHGNNRIFFHRWELLLLFLCLWAVPPDESGWSFTQTVRQRMFPIWGRIKEQARDKRRTLMASWCHTFSFWAQNVGTTRQKEPHTVHLHMHL